MSKWADHPGVRTGEDLTFGERAAEGAVRGIGSWTFLVWQTIIVAAWIALNITGLVRHWDPYPFILLNLAFSTQASYAAPIILLAQRRTDERNAEKADHDLQTDLDTNMLVHRIADHLNLGNTDV